MSPVVSVVIPVHNADRFLATTLLSLQKQSEPNWEALIVVDPKSTDGSIGLAKKFAQLDHRFRIHRSPGAGVAAARNLGLKLARGGYIAFLDADDIWHPEKLARQLTALKISRADICSTGFRRLSQDGRRLGRAIRPPQQISYARLLQQNCILMSSAMVRRSATRGHLFKEIGCEDFAFWLELLGLGRTAVGLAQILTQYRIVQGSRGSNKLRTLKESWQVLRQRPDLSLAQDLYHITLITARGALKHAIF